MTRRSHPDVVVVGGGIVGAACAGYLAAEGLEVLVLDAGFPGGGATGAGMGHLVVMDETEAQFALTSYSLELWTELAAELSADCQDEPRSTLWIAADEEELALVEAKATFYRHRGVAAEVLSSSELAGEEPELRPGLAGALHVPGDRVIYPPAAACWLLERAVEMGTAVQTDCRVEEIGSGWVRTASGEKISCDLVVNAAGPEAPRLTPGLPVEPRKGHLAITERYPDFCRHQLVELGYLKSAHAEAAESVAFNIQPRATGQQLIGSSRELVGWDLSINRRLLAAMIRRAFDFLPRLADLQVIRVWTGFRPATPDGLPLIGPWPRTDGLWIAAGHEGLGITMALGTGRLLAESIVGRQPVLDPAPYEPARLES